MSFIPAIRDCTFVRADDSVAKRITHGEHVIILYLDIDALRFSEREMRENNCIRIANIKFRKSIAYYHRIFSLLALSSHVKKYARLAISIVKIWYPYAHEKITDVSAKCKWYITKMMTFVVTHVSTHTHVYV